MIMMYMMGTHVGLIGMAVSILVLILLIKLLVGLSLIHKQHQEKNPTTKLKKNIKNYRDSGLSDSDIKLFRETMGEAKRQIELWSKANQSKTDLSVIEDVTGGLASAKKTFQFIVQNPQELTKQSDFLYKDLPNIVKLIESYDKLKAEPVKNERDLSETLLLLKTLSAQVAENYHEILMKDVKIIGEEVQNG